MPRREDIQGVEGMTTQASKEEAFQRLRQDLRGPFDLSIDRKPETQYFHMQTQFVHFGFDGKRTGVETYLLRLRCIPAALSGKNLDEYMCREFGLQLNTGGIATIPALKFFTYRFDLMSGIDRKGPVFGIPHELFEGITDSMGNKLSPDIRYAVYNNFIDFHMLVDIFSRPMKFGKGIQDLKFVGDRVIHAAAFTEAPFSLGTAIKQGSVFRNGEVTLELKGISVIDGAVCALVGYDSGESTLKMIMALSKDQEVVTKGGSEYKGDIYIDLETGWVRKVTLDEFVVTETETANAPTKIHGYTVRHILLRLISQQDFEKQISIIS
jgi:hypothetical protein